MALAKAQLIDKETANTSDRAIQINGQITDIAKLTQGKIIWIQSIYYYLHKLRLLLIRKVIELSFWKLYLLPCENHEDIGENSKMHSKPKH